ncbi:MAG: PAC2 family protein [Candidatus Nanopelagicaceae bacterium]
MLVAFTGWNDAGESASQVISHLLDEWEGSLVAEFDPEDFYDIHVNRPAIKLDERGAREIIWPTTKIFSVKHPHSTREVLLVLGAEPSMRWKSFSSELLDVADDYEVDLLVMLGGLLADVPHSRPIAVSATASDPMLAKELGVEPSQYEGITGILGVIGDEARNRELNALSLWAAVPHYVSTTPSPKATLALIEALEEHLGLKFPIGNLKERATIWESNVDRMAAEDSEVGDYVRELERSKDDDELREATGDSIAKEVERFLRRQENS